MKDHSDSSDRRPEERALARFLETHPRGDEADYDAWAAEDDVLRADADLAALTRELFLRWKRTADLLGDGTHSTRRRTGGSFFRALAGEREATPEETRAAGLQPGQRIGHFTLRRFIASGGMGQVWEAHDETLRTEVALKLILPGRVDVRSLDLFAREARAGGRLRHPYIVTTLSTGRAGGLTWIAQELVDGSWTAKDLLDTLRAEDKVPKDHYKQVALFVARIADGLQAAHDAGVIHRDVKPANILIAPDDTPRLTDFGLARVVDDSFLSQSGDLAGTWSYMSPEQVTAKRMGLDHRTDIFSLGVVLYELLTLRRPFEGDTTHQIAEQIITHEPPQPSKIRSQCPRELAIICGKALEKAPSRRYASMRELTADLHRHLNNEPIHAKPVGPLVRGLKWVNRNPGKATSALAVASLVLVLLLSWFWVREQQSMTQDALARESDARIAAEMSERAALVQEQRALDASERARKSIYALQIQAAAAAIDDGELSKAQRILRDCNDDLRGWEWAHLGLKADASFRILRDPGKFIGRIAWSTDGRHLVSGTADGIVCSWDVGSGHQTVLLDEAGLPRLRRNDLGPITHLERRPASCWDLSPDGSQIAMSMDNHAIRLTRLNAPQLVTALVGHSADVTGLAWSPDGERILSVSRDRSIRIWSPRSGGPSELVEELLEPAFQVLWSPDGSRFVTASDTKVIVWNSSSLQRSHVIEDLAGVRGVDWSPTGVRLAIRQSNSVSLRAMGSLDEVILSGHEATIYALEWSPNGELIATGSDDGTVRIWDPESGLERCRFTQHEDVVRGLAWSPDSSRLASASFDRTVRVWDPWVGSAVTVFRGHEADVCGVSWSSNGAFIASSSLDSTVRIWNAEGRSASSVLAIGEREVDGVWLEGKGDRVRVHSAQGGFSLWSLHDGGLLVGAEGGLLSDSDEYLSPDGLRVAVIQPQNGVSVLRGSDRLELAAYTGFENPIRIVEWSADGQRLAAGDGFGNVRLLSASGHWEPVVLRVPEFVISEVVPGMLSGPRLSTPHSPALVFEPAIAWSPDGARIASASDYLTIRVWDTREAEVLTELRGHADIVRDLSWSPDGSRIASTARDSTVRIWDAGTGDELLAIDLSPWNHVAPVWSPDGATLIIGGLVLHSDPDRAVAWGREAELRRQVDEIIDPLFHNLGLLEDVLRTIAEKHELSPQFRERCQEFARYHGDCSVEELHDLAEKLVLPEGEPGRDLELGLRLARRAVELSPYDSKLRITLAWALYANGRLDESLRVAQKALSLAKTRELGSVHAEVVRLRSAVDIAAPTGEPR